MAAASSQAALHELALSYLDRFPCTEARLRRHLRKKIQAAIDAGTSPSEAWPWLDAVVGRLVEVGLVDDQRWAEGRVAALRRRGRSERYIRQDLRKNGVGPEHADAALEGEDEAMELRAAINLARRRRLGPFCAESDRAARRQKHLSAIARGGFSFPVASRVIDAESPEALWELVEDE